MAETLPAEIRPVTLGTPQTPGHFLSGFVAPLRAVKYIFTHPSLIPYSTLPLLANMAILVLLFFIFAPHTRGFIEGWIPTTGWARTVLYIPMIMLGYGIALLVGAVFVNLFGTLIASPFNDVLSGRVEALEGRLPAGTATTWAQAVGRFGLVLIDEIKKWTVYLAVMALLVPLMIVPVAGHVAFTVLGSLVTFWFLGFEYLDYCFSRRLMRFSDRRAFCWRNKTAIIGLGAAIASTTMIPFAGLVVMPLAVVGATLVFLELHPASSDQPQPQQAS